MALCCIPIGAMYASFDQPDNYDTCSANIATIDIDEDSNLYKKLQHMGRDIVND